MNLSIELEDNYGYNIINLNKHCTLITGVNKL